jgi:hypothetical protein
VAAVAAHTQGFERQMATNHLGHAALVAALCDAADAD